MSSGATAPATPSHSDRAVAPARIPAGLTFAILAVILLIGAATRFVNLQFPAPETDEYWHLELSTGRGSVEKHLPTNQLLTFDHKPTSLAGAEPWWTIWGSMDDTVHPPLYVIALRFWRTVFGEGIIAGRSLGALTSLISILLMFELVRRVNGTAPALWSAAIFAVASPQIALARSLRGYTFELMWILATALAVVVIAKRPRRSWWLLLALALTTMVALLSHYFAAFAIAGIGLYALLALRGRARIDAAGAMALAAIAVVIAWSPELREQIRTLPSASESWIADASSGHIGRAIGSFASIPLRMLFEPRRQVETITLASAVLFMLPVVLLKQRKNLLLWVLWLWCATTPLLTIDLLRQTKHLSFIRYVLIAGPPVYALAAALLAHLPRPLLRNALPAVVLLACILSLSSAYDAPRGDFAEMSRFIDENRIGGQPVIFASGDNGWVPAISFVALSDESKTFPWPVIVSNEAPMNARLLEQVRESGGAILIRDSDAFPIESILPDAKTDAYAFVPWAGMIVHVKLDRRPINP